MIDEKDDEDFQYDTCAQRHRYTKKAPAPTKAEIYFAQRYNETRFRQALTGKPRKRGKTLAYKSKKYLV